MPVASGGIRTVWITSTIAENPKITLMLSPEGVVGAVPVNWAKSEPKVHLPLTITFAGRTPLAGDAQD